MRRNNKIKRIALVICMVIVLQFVLPILNEVKAVITDNFTLIKSDIVTITKNTTISQINDVYGKEADIITTSPHGGHAYTWYKENYTDLIFVETNEQEKIVSAGIYAKNFDTLLYSYGEKKTGRVSYMQGSIIDDWDEGVQACFVYNKDVLNVDKYVEEYMKDASNYDKKLCKHTIAILNQSLVNDGYIELQFDEDLYDKIQRIEDSGMNLEDYITKNGKENYYKFAGSPSNYLSLYEALPNPFRLASPAINYTTSDTCKYAYFRYHIDDPTSNSGTKMRTYYVSKGLVENTNAIIKLTDEENEKYNKAKKIYKDSVELFNQNSATVLEEDLNFETLPLVAGKIYESKLIGSTMYLNAIRVCGGLPELEHSVELSNYAQHKAVLTMYMSANKIPNYTPHTPPKPDGVDEKFYNNAMRAMSAENLYSGDIITSITHAINDVYGDPITCGHRYNLLNPSTKYFGMGYCAGQGCHKFSGVQSHNVPAVAWPSIGITPMEAFSGGYWSISLYNYTTTPNTTVDVVRLNDNTKWLFTERTTLSSSTNRLYVSNSYISFYNSSLTGSDGVAYQITLRNLKNGENDVPEYTYRTIFKKLYSKSIEVVYPESVNLDKDTLQLDAGQKKSLTPKFTENATEIATNWTSSNENVATVSQYGIVTAKNKGEATITVTALNGKTATCKVVVNGKINLSENIKDLKINETVKINLTEDISDISYISNNENIARVDSNGNVTGISGGMSVITVLSPGYKNDIYVVYVKEPLTYPDGSIGYVGDTNFDGVIDSVDFAYISNNRGTNDVKQKLMCDLNKDGVVDAKDLNFLNEFTKRGKNINLCYEHIQKLELDESDITILIGSTKKVNAKIIPNEVIDNKVLIWKSLNENIAQVDSSGNITARNKGNTTVTVTTSNGKKASINVNVIDYQKGDYNEDGQVDISDAYLLLRAIVNETKLSDRKIQIVDMDDSLEIDITDAYLLLRTVIKNM